MEDNLFRERLSAQFNVNFRNSDETHISEGFIQFVFIAIEDNVYSMKMYEHNKPNIKVCMMGERIQADEPCCICMENCPNVRTQCNHDFCSSCITETIFTHRNANCPICRENITTLCFEKEELMNNVLETYKEKCEYRPVCK